MKLTNYLGLASLATMSQGLPDLLDQGPLPGIKAPPYAKATRYQTCEKYPNGPDILNAIKQFCSAKGAFPVPGTYAATGTTVGQVHVSIQVNGACSPPIMFSAAQCMDNFWYTCTGDDGISSSDNGGENDLLFDGCALYIIHFAGTPSVYKRSLNGTISGGQTFPGKGPVLDKATGRILDFEQDILQGREFRPEEW